MADTFYPFAIWDCSPFGPWGRDDCKGRQNRSAKLDKNLHPAPLKGAVSSKLLFEVISTTAMAARQTRPLDNQALVWTNATRPHYQPFYIGHSRGLEIGRNRNPQ